MIQGSTRNYFYASVMAPYNILKIKNTLVKSVSCVRFVTNVTLAFKNFNTKMALFYRIQKSGGAAISIFQRTGQMTTEFNLLTQG